MTRSMTDWGIAIWCMFASCTRRAKLDRPEGAIQERARLQASDMSDDKRRVLIAGGGPVGLLTALLLGRSGIPVRLFDLNDGPQADPRAATTHPATLDALDETGLVPGMMRVGLVAPIVQFWDRPSGAKIAEFDHALLVGDTKHPYVVQCEQFKTAQLVLDRLAGLGGVETLWGHEVVDVAQSDGGVTVEVRGPSGIE